MKNGLSDAIIHQAAAGIAAVSERGRALDEFLDTCPKTIRPGVSHLLFSYYRHKRFVDATLDGFLKHPPRPPVLALLRAAAAQIFFQSAIPPESAVNVAVDAAKAFRAAALANAVLRRITETRPPVPETPREVLPDALYADWSARFDGETLAEQTRAILTEPPFAFRMCRDFAPPEEAEALPGWGGFRFFSAAEPRRILDSEAFRAGGIYIQDPATSLAPSLPDCTQVSSALELCAAPGGKTLMLAEKLRPEARLVAADRSARRQELTEKNCAAHNVAATVIVAEPQELYGSYDLVVADTPCGNSGVYRRRPDAMWRFAPEIRSELAALQRAILDEGARLTAPGGQLVYSTCSIEPEENELNVAAFLAKHPEFQLLKSRLLLPSCVNDGAFAALLVRSRDAR